VARARARSARSVRSRARVGAQKLSRRVVPSCAQGEKFKLKKPERAKAKRQAQGDQQKLKRGNWQLAPKIAKKQVEDRAHKELTKKITARIEQTMAARASTDSGGLAVVKVDESGTTKLLRTGSAVLASKKR